MHQKHPAKEKKRKEKKVIQDEILIVNERDHLILSLDLSLISCVVKVTASQDIGCERHLAAGSRHDSRDERYEKVTRGRENHTEETPAGAPQKSSRFHGW